MHVIKYLDSRFQHLLQNLQTKLADGADGEVWKTKSSKRVAKFSIFFPWNGENLADIAEQRRQIFKKVVDRKDLFVEIFRFDHLLDSTRKTVDGDQSFSIFYYEMEELLKISEDERKVMHSLVSHEDSNIHKEISLRKAIPILDGLSFGLDFDKDKVCNFIKKLQKLETDGIMYSDLHPRNIMKNSEGEFKLVDIDRMSIF